jgi:anthranilate phosphoribosyltransferase
MSDIFREIIKKVGSGPHTSKNLTRSEAQAATELMLRQEATPAQIGAFLIAHRIKRPTGEELAGMLDAYDLLGPRLQPLKDGPSPLVLGIPYDGRSRTAPLSPLTVLMLTAAGYPVILHGGDRMPTKYGTPLIEVWQRLGIDWTTLSLEQVQQVLEQSQLGFVYTPRLFPAAQTLIPYREQIGKRPPFATLELIWSPYAGAAHLVAGYVHPPTEELFRQALALRGGFQLTTVKGLEGSCDLPRDRTPIIGHYWSDDGTEERLLLHPHDYGLAGAEVPWMPTSELVAAIQATLRGQSSALMQAAIWNGGFYLWHCGLCSTLDTGLGMAESLLTQGEALQQLHTVAQAVARQAATASSPAR